jgi:hypothetical protein
MNSSQPYLEFVEFVKKDSELDRAADTRRVIGLFIWCFLAPAAIAGVLFGLSQAGVIGPRWSGLIDLLMILFPVIYSFQFLGISVLRQLPRALRQGNVRTVLDSCAQEARWRDSTVQKMRDQVRANPQEWRLLAQAFQFDLDAMLRRSRYLTVLGGAIFFLLMQGLDSLGSPVDLSSAHWVRNPQTGWLEAKSDEVIQMGGLTLFLILLYLSGTQTHHALQRYQVCAKQIADS